MPNAECRNTKVAAAFGRSFSCASQVCESAPSRHSRVACRCPPKHVVWIALDHGHGLAVACDEGVEGWTVERDCSRTVLLDCIRSKPAGGYSDDRAVYADRYRADRQRAVAVELDHFDDRLWLWDTGDDGVSRCGEHIRPSQRFQAAWGAALVRLCEAAYTQDHCGREEGAPH